MFGGICRGSRLSFMVEVARRDTQTLLEAIRQHIAPGAFLRTFIQPRTSSSNLQVSSSGVKMLNV